MRGHINLQSLNIGGVDDDDDDNDDFISCTVNSTCPSVVLREREREGHVLGERKVCPYDHGFSRSY